MQQLTHLCGQELSRASFGLITASGPAYAYAARRGRRLVEVLYCPTCREALCDTDMRDADGQPLTLDSPSDWSLARRAALAGLAATGYTLIWDEGWRIWTDSEAHVSYSSRLDAAIELASAIAAGQTPIKLSWVSLHGGVENIWEGVYDAPAGTAIGHAGDGPNETIQLAIDGDRVELRRDGSAPQIGRVWRRGERLLEVEFSAK